MKHNSFNYRLDSAGEQIVTKMYRSAGCVSVGSAAVDISPPLGVPILFGVVRRGV